MVNKDMFYFADIDERFINETKNLEGLEDGVNCFKYMFI